MFNRRDFLKTAATAGTFIGSHGISTALLPAWAQSESPDLSGIKVLSGTEFDLEVGKKTVFIDGKPGNGITVNNQLPAPLLRWKEGDDITLRVKNNLAVDTSIHWHGILLPFQMDGVPGVTYPGIKPDETFTYKFPVKQAGTFWYHSHSGLQEQSGHYGPIIIEPKNGYPQEFDREYVMVLSDWTFENPHRLFDKLKKMGHGYNYQQRDLAEFLADVRKNGLGATIADRNMWGAMRMTPTDLSDVTGASYTYLINGHGPTDNWTGIFEPGERIRLRIINSSAMTIFKVRIPGLPMTVVQADGLDVKPIETDEFQMGVAETYDVIIEPKNRAYTFMCESIERAGFSRATFAPRTGMTAEVPALRERPKLTMKDMGGMDHGDMDMSEMDHAAMGHDMPASDPEPEMDHSQMDHSSMGHNMPAEEPVVDHSMMDHNQMEMDNLEMQTHNHAKDHGVANIAMSPVSRLHEPGIGLENTGHRVLTYMDLEALVMNPDMRPPGREIELHLTSNMERYMWSFDGIKFSEIKDNIFFKKDERLRLTMVNDTMMPHPIHLHGMFFDVVTVEGSHFKPRKHTIIVKPGEKLSVDITADAIGDWAFHCHLMYHMHAGMFRVVSVRDQLPGETS
tara:strand:- start:190093 stop:191958 length:1866 start_codon:yes stop_codon:yes gene_type:complete